MPVWDYTLNVKDIWDSFEEYGFEASRDEIVKRIEVSDFWEKEWGFILADIVDGLKFSEDLEDFNYWWNDFYDFADAFRIWVKTF